MVLSCDILPNFSDESPKFPPTGQGGCSPPSPLLVPPLSLTLILIMLRMLKHVLSSPSIQIPVVFAKLLGAPLRVTNVWGPSVLCLKVHTVRYTTGLASLLVFFGMRICTRIIPLRVEPWIKMDVPQPPYCRQRKSNHSYPLQTSEQKLGRFFSVGEMQFLTYAVYSAERRNNLKTKGFG